MKQRNSLFGWSFRKDTSYEEPKSFAPEVYDDGATIIQPASGGYGTYLDLSGGIKTESELITKYREISLNPDVKSAIDDIVNEAIVMEDEEDVVSIILDDLPYNDNIKDMITKEFKNILDLLNFNKQSYDIFQRWYIDGRFTLNVIIDGDNTSNGITELRYIDPRKIKKIREIEKKRTKKDITTTQTKQEYYIYNERGFSNGPTHVVSSVTSSVTSTGIKIAADAIVQITSGLMSPNDDTVLSYLHEAIRPLNQLTSLEDSVIIYRLARAPERRIFNVEVGGLPPMKVEQYMKDTMTKFKNKIVYNASTGEVADDRKYMSMLEDFWFPKRDGRGTEVTTLPSGQLVGELNDVEMIRNKLYRALNVPVSRQNPDSMFSFGKSSEITRDEIKFHKFINRLRLRFSHLFSRLLEKQLILKSIITKDEWNIIDKHIRFRWAEDNLYSELKEAEIWSARANLLQELDSFSGKYYSHEWIRKNVLRQTDDIINSEDIKIQEEMNNPQYYPQNIETEIETDENNK